MSLVFVFWVIILVLVKEEGIEYFYMLDIEFVIILKDIFVMVMFSMLMGLDVNDLFKILVIM